MQLTQIKPYHYYSNGQYGNRWSVRQILGESEETESKEKKITYQIVAGPNRRKRDICTRTEFANWAVYEVFRNENSWQKIL